MGKNILCFLLKGRFIFRAFKTGKWQALTLFFNRLLAALWRMYYSRAGNKISETGKLGIYFWVNLTEMMVIWWGVSKSEESSIIFTFCGTDIGWQVVL